MFASIIKRELKESEETEQGGESATSSSPTIESKHRKSQELRLSDSGDLRTEGISPSSSLSFSFLPTPLSFNFHFHFHFHSSLFIRRAATQKVVYQEG